MALWDYVWHCKMVCVWHCKMVCVWRCKIVCVWRCAEIADHLSKHGDAVKDVGFQVEDLDAIFKVSGVLFRYSVPSRNGIMQRNRTDLDSEGVCVSVCVCSQNVTCELAPKLLNRFR